MAYPKLGILYGLAVAVEGTRGTYAAPAMATDAIPLAEEPEVEHGFVLPGGRDGVAVGGYGVPPSATPLGRYARIRFATEIIGSGAATTPPRWGRLLRPFMTETVGGSDVSYQPSAAAEQSLSVLLQHGEKQYQLVGAVPESITIVGAPDEARVLLRCTIAGKLNAAPTEQALQAQTFQATDPIAFQGAFTAGGTTLIYEDFELDLGLAARPWRVDRNTTDALLHGLVTQVNPRLRFPPEVVALATHDPFSRQAAPQTALAYSQRLGLSAGKRLLITGDHIEYDAAEPIPLRSNNGLMYYSPLSLRFARLTGGTWFKISHD